jgi:hypothetical protein
LAVVHLEEGEKIWHEKQLQLMRPEAADHLVGEELFSFSYQHLRRLSPVIFYHREAGNSCEYLQHTKKHDTSLTFASTSGCLASPNAEAEEEEEGGAIFLGGAFILRGLFVFFFLSIFVQLIWRTEQEKKTYASAVTSIAAFSSDIFSICFFSLSPRFLFPFQVVIDYAAKRLLLRTVLLFQSAFVSNKGMQTSAVLPASIQFYRSSVPLVALA